MWISVPALVQGSFSMDKVNNVGLLYLGFRSLFVYWWFVLQPMLASLEAAAEEVVTMAGAGRVGAAAQEAILVEALVGIPVEAMVEAGPVVEAAPEAIPVGV